MANNMLVRRTMSNPGVELRVRNQQHSTRDRQTMQRTIIKQGYLKKLPNASRLGASFKKVERRWFIFGIIGLTDPYLEYYENEDSIFGSQPLNIIFLDTCYKISRDQKTSRYTNIFTLVLKERQLSLVAPTRDAMFEWSRAIEGKLCNLGIIETSHGANDYIQLPTVDRRYPEEGSRPTETNYLEVLRSSGTFSASTQERDYLEVHASGGTFAGVPSLLHSNGQDRSNAPTEVCYANLTAEQRATEVSEDTYDVTVSASATEDAPVYMIASPATDNVYMNLAKCTTDSEVTDSMTLEVALSTVPSATAFQEQSSTQSVDVASAALTKPLSSSPPSTLLLKTLDDAHSDTPSVSSAILHAAPSCTEQSALQSPTMRSAAPPCALASMSVSSELKIRNRNSVPFHLPSYDEAMTSPDEVLSRYGDLRFSSHLLATSVNTSSGCSASPADHTSSNNELSTNSASGIAEFPPPPPYSLTKVLLKGANLPLKQIQVQKLIEEMNDPQGIQVVIPKNQCQHSIAFTDCFNKIWISGWNQQTCPTFHSFLHIGDQLIAINGVASNSRATAKKLLMTCSGKTDATLTIRRIPCGRVIAMRKDNSAVESIGVALVNGTSEIGFIDPTGLARQSGLEENAPAVGGSGGSGSWWITEINHQPLNLFYKDDEAKHRLKAMGNYITFVVQPTQLILEMKKQLKNLKGFRSFIVQ